MSYFNQVVILGHMTFFDPLGGHMSFFDPTKKTAVKNYCLYQNLKKNHRPANKPAISPVHSRPQVGHLDHLFRSVEASYIPNFTLAPHGAQLLQPNYR